MTPLAQQEHVEKLLPQKFPFVMVDTLFSFTEDSIRSGYRVDEKNIFVDSGRFAEAGLIEHMAQSVALHTGYQYFLRNQPAPTGYIGSIKEINIFCLPAVNDEIVTEVNILQEFMGITLVAISTTLNAVEIASGQMKTVLAR
jgi:3-hydroxyacyl-[acyl-carrier-protein] dehydratase